jgi:hypothetical protein
MPLRVGLTYSQMKLAWALKRLDELKSEIGEFRKNAYRITTRDDARRSLHRVNIEQSVTPDSVGMLIGEFAFLAWQLALLTTDKPNLQTSFPIDAEGPLSSNKSYREKIADIPPKALSVIESLQPYKAGLSFRRHPLWQLNKLCNIDKHCVVAIAHIALAVRVDGISKAWGNDQRNSIEIGVPLVEKDKLELEVNVPGIVFGEPIDKTDGVSGFEITLDGLRSVCDFVRQETVPRFEGFFR